jgi:hypothetical protein
MKTLGLSLLGLVAVIYSISSLEKVLSGAMGNVTSTFSHGLLLGLALMVAVGCVCHCVGRLLD